MPEKDIDIRNLLKSGERLAAMNLYHERYGGELAEVRANIEEMETDDAITGYYPATLCWENITDLTFRNTVVSMLQKGQRIAAVRLCRERYPDWLKYAKQAVLAWHADLGLDPMSASATEEETCNLFDIRWHYTVHPSRKIWFRKQTDSFIEFRFEMQIADLTISDMGKGNAVDLFRLIASTTDGEYGIFTCTCGVMTCGGFQAVEVVHLDGKTLWYDMGHWNIFREADYKAVIHRVEQAFQELRENYPTVPIHFPLYQQ